MRTPKTAKADVSFIRQETQFSCCAASIASALKAHGKDMTEAGVNKVLGASPMGGATWEAMLATVQYFGLRGTLVVPSTIAQLKAWTDAGIPVIIAWNPEGRPWSHASTVFHVDDDHTVSVMDANIPDPSETVRVVPKAEFYKKWYEAIGDKLIVRRPAMAVEREVTVDGRQVMAGKKELRSMKDRGMSRHLKHGPVRPVDKSDTQSAMSKAQWEIRKEEGRAGLPGAGMGAGAHKDKSRYDRGEGKGVEREAGSLTQPLMTRRDYGSLQMDLNEVEQTLKLAVNLPADVERYVEEGTDAGMPEDKAWAVAWSRYCAFKNPESEHCQMNKSEYFPGRKAKFERGVSMTVDEVAKVVGPEFKEMNEDPPESVVKVMEGMQGKTAKLNIDADDILRRALLTRIITPDEAFSREFQRAAESAAEYINSYWPEGEGFGSSDWTSVLSDFLSNAGVEVKYVGGKLTRKASISGKTAGDDNSEGLQKAIKATKKMLTDLLDMKLPKNIEDPLRKAIETNLKSYESQMKASKTAHRPTLFAMDAFAEMLKDGKFEKGKSMTVDEVADVVGPEFKEMNEDPPASVVKLREEMSKTAAINWTTVATSLLKASKGLTEEDFHYRAYLRAIISDDSATAKHLVSKFKGAEKARYELIDEAGKGKTAAVLAGGKYGFTKGTESACGVGVNKLQKSASRIATALYAKDEGSPAFLAKHAMKGGSKTASMLLKAMESIGPMAALMKHGKTAGKSGTGLYGFSEKSAKLGLDACTALHHEAGMIAGDLFARKGADPMKVAGYLAVNAKKGKCAYSAMLSEVSPDIDAAVISKKAAGGFDTDYIGGGSYSINAPKAWLEKLIAAFPKSFPRPRMMPNPNGPNDSLFTKNEKVVRAAEKWFSENGLQMTKKASDFLASVDDDEIDSNEEVFDIISKC